jgi:hypothetical protein
VKYLLLSITAVIMGCSDFIIQPRPEEPITDVNKIEEPYYIGEWCITNGSFICTNVKSYNVTDSTYMGVYEGMVYIPENNDYFKFIIHDEEMTLILGNGKKAYFRKK